MSKIAIIKTGGKQYVVKENQELKIEKLPQNTGDNFDLTEILLVADGEKVQVGRPLVEGAKVAVKLTEQGRSKKVRVVKYKAKTRYHKVQGHRQPYSKIKIDKIY